MKLPRLLVSAITPLTFAACLLVTGRTLALDVDTALRTQRAVQMDTPLNRTQWLGAHNAWNDGNVVWSNQRWTAERLLDAGIRAFDLDVHRNSSGQIKLCHESCSAIYGAQDNYEAELAKYARWLASHPGEILFIDIEDKINDGPAVMDPLRRQFGSWLYVPGDKPQDRWETPREMLARGKRVIVKSANQTYGQTLIWEGWRFAGNAPGGYNYQPVKDFNTATCNLNQDSFYGVMDSKVGEPFVRSDTGRIDPSNIPALLRCGLDFVDADRWDDAMRQAAVWTWGEGEPNNYNNDEDCAEMSGNGRWNDVWCGNWQSFACQNPDNPDDFRVTSGVGNFDEGQARCEDEFPDFDFSVPQNAYQNARLQAAAGGRTVWLSINDRANEGQWQR